MQYDDHAAYLFHCHGMNEPERTRKLEGGLQGEHIFSQAEELRDCLIDGSPLSKKQRAFLAHLLIELLKDRDRAETPKNGRPQGYCLNDLTVYAYWLDRKAEGKTKEAAHAQYEQERRKISLDAFKRSITRGSAAAKQGENLTIAYRFGVE